MATLRDAALDAALEDNYWERIDREMDALAGPVAMPSATARPVLIVPCAGCGGAFVWLNGEIYTPDEVNEFGQPCDMCGARLHPECSELFPDQEIDPREGESDMEVCAGCLRKIMERAPNHARW